MPEDQAMQDKTAPARSSPRRPQGEGTPTSSSTATEIVGEVPFEEFASGSMRLLKLIRAR